MFKGQFLVISACLFGYVGDTTYVSVYEELILMYEISSLNCSSLQLLSDTTANLFV